MSASEESTTLRRVGTGSLAIFYLFVAAEVIIMITPFATYFYSIYAPVLDFFNARPATAWLTAFFLPHISYPGNPVLSFLAYLGPVLFGLGLGIFFVCAGQVYYAKLFRKGAVTGGFYRMVRHPQYLGLAIAGLGLLLFWPRFLILVTFITMLFLYYLLAWDEERRMLEQFGDSYGHYMAEVPMFVPGALGKRFPPSPEGSARFAGAVATAYVVALVAGTVLAFGLRAYTTAQLPPVSVADLTVVRMYPAAPPEAEQIIRTALDAPETRAIFARHGAGTPMTHVAYLMLSTYMMAHILSASVEAHEEHHGSRRENTLVATARHLKDMFFLLPQRQLRDADVTPIKRVIVTGAVVPWRGPASPGAVLSVEVQRVPFLIVDVDDRSGKAVAVMESEPRNAWGTIPLPSF